MTARAGATGRGDPEPTGRGRVWLPVASVVLGVLAVSAVLIAVVALASGSSLGATAGTPVVAPTGAPSPGGAPPPGTPSPRSSAPAPGTIRPYPPLPGAPGGQPAPGAPSITAPVAPAGPGGIADARQRVSGFVAALNDGDFDRANEFLCTSMAGSYGESSLNGIVPGTLGVGGVVVRGDTGTAIVTFRLTDGTDPGRTVFGLVVEHGTWMVCQPQ